MPAGSSNAAEPRIPVFQPYLGPEVRDAISQALDAGWISIGSLTYRLEEEVGRYLQLDGRELVSLSSGTAALHAAAILAGLEPGDEVICPSFTYVACHQAMSATGADIVFCDVEDETLGLDPARALELVSERTKAILPVHYAGIPCRIDELYDLAREHGLRVIEDAAHAFGSSHGGRLIGSFGDLVCFSFGPVKVLSTFEGGALVTSTSDEAQAVRELRILGVDTDRALRRDDRMWDYDVARQGYKYHLGSILSSVGLANLALLETVIANRQRYCRFYNERFAGVPEVTTPATDFENVAPFLYFVRVPDAAARADLVAHLESRGVASGVHFQGAHEFSLYRSCRRGDLSTTELLSEQQLTLPLHPFMDDATLERVADGVTSFFR
jgi:dTDP-4-amino-4,6-dideoxygalactose transaminase